MKIVIEHKGIKREINGTGFNICGDGNELRQIAEQILEKSAKCGYGWIRVRDAIPDEHFSGPNTPPLPWA